MGNEYVDIDLHRRRPVIYRMDEAGERIDCVRIRNDPVWFAKEVSKAPKGSDVMIELVLGRRSPARPRLRRPPVRSPGQRLGQAPAGYHGSEPFSGSLDAIAKRCGRTRPTSHRPQSSHARLLRPPRRRDSPSRAPSGGVRLGHTGRELG